MIPVNVAHWEQMTVKAAAAERSSSDGWRRIFGCRRLAAREAEELTEKRHAKAGPSSAAVEAMERVRRRDIMATHIQAAAHIQA